MVQVSGCSSEEQHLCTNGDLFARRPQKVAVAMPREEEYTWLADFNKDGREDILMHHPSATEPHRLTILMAR